MHIAWNQSSPEGPPSVNFDDYKFSRYAWTNPRFDSAKNKFERMNPRFDSQERERGRTDVYYERKLGRLDGKTAL